MKKPLALLAALLALATPLSANAHRAWLVPTTTVLSGTEAWVGFDAGASKGGFIADHNTLRLDGLVVTGPDGSKLDPRQMMQDRYRTTVDLHLTQQGTYRVAEGSMAYSARYNGAVEVLL